MSKQTQPAPGLHGDALGASLPADLAEVAARWATLPDALKSGILAMVRACLAARPDAAGEGR